MEILRERIELRRTLPVVLNRVVENTNALNEVLQPKEFTNIVLKYAPLECLALARNGGRVTYANSPTDKYNRSRRVILTLGRYINRRPELKAQLAAIGITEAIVKFISDTLKATATIAPRVTVGSPAPGTGWAYSIDTGKDIIDNYKNHIGGSSCMTGSKAHLVKVYALNPDKVAHLILWEDGRRIGRALLWTADDGKKYLDRIYVYPHSHNSDECIRVYEAIAVQLGIITRKSQSIAHSSGEAWGDIDIKVTLAANLKKKMSRSYLNEYYRAVMPYADSFRYGYDNPDGSLTVYNRGHKHLPSGYQYSYTDTHGRTDVVYNNLGSGLPATCCECGRIIKTSELFGRVTVLGIICKDCYAMQPRNGIRSCSSCGLYHLPCQNKYYNTEADNSSIICPICIARWNMASKKTKRCLACGNAYSKNELTGGLCSGCLALPHIAAMNIPAVEPTVEQLPLNKIYRIKGKLKCLFNLLSAGQMSKTAIVNTGIFNSNGLANGYLKHALGRGMITEDNNLYSLTDTGRRSLELSEERL